MCTRTEENKFSYFLLTPDGWAEAGNDLPNVLTSSPKEELDEYAVHFEEGRTELTAEGL